MAGAVRLDDLARPRLPWPVRALNVAARPLAPRLDADALCDAAARATGLSDFGDEGFREPLAVLVGALEREARLTPLGRLMTRQLLSGLLRTRLRAEALIARHPQILSEHVRAPIVIVGLPRSGTTHLHNLIAADPELRSLPYYESLDPVPENARELMNGAEDPRVRRCEQALRLQHWLMPHFRAMHEMGPHERHEEIQLLALAFSTMLFESAYRVPSYRDWYKASDQTGAYLYLKRMLQVLQWLRGPRRWVLKSPQHLEQIGPLLTAFPDARIVQTHRDPLPVTASLCTMITYGLRMQGAGIDPRDTGRYWADRVEDLLRGSVEGRTRIRPERVLDVHFAEFTADNLATVERIYSFAGQPLGDKSRAAITTYHKTHRPGRFGRIDYHLADFALDPADLRSRLGFYSEYFGVAEE